ncbi:hypothetical protein YC2023_105358 [Brassica napus]
MGCAQSRVDNEEAVAEMQGPPQRHQGSGYGEQSVRCGPLRLRHCVEERSLCCITFDFAVKRQTLLELLDFVGSGSVRFTEPAVLEMCRMFAVNLFIVFPPSYRENDGDDNEPVFDPA